MQRMLRCLAVFGVVLGLAATGLNGAKAAELEKLRLAYASNVPGPDSVFLFAGKQLGFFKDEGIDLEIQIAGGTTAAAAFVASGTSDVALGGLEAMPGYLERGVAMKAIYVYAYRPIFSLAFLKGGKVSSIEGLKGTRVGVLTLSSGSVPVLQYILKEAGMQMSDVQLVPVGVGAAAISAIKSGQVAALMFHDTGFAAFEANGVSFDYYSSPRLEKGYAGQGIYALDGTIKNRASTMQRFVRAVTKSLEYSIASPAAATKAFGELYPDAATNPQLTEALWRERIKICRPDASGEKMRWGYMGNDGWENLLDVLVLGDLIKQRPQVDRLYTTQFLETSNATVK